MALSSPRVREQVAAPHIQDSSSTLKERLTEMDTRSSLHSMTPVQVGLPSPNGSGKKASPFQLFSLKKDILSTHKKENPTQILTPRGFKKGELAVPVHNHPGSTKASGTALPSGGKFFAFPVTSTT